MISNLSKNNTPITWRTRLICGDFNISNLVNTFVDVGCLDNIFTGLIINLITIIPKDRISHCGIKYIKIRVKYIFDFYKNILILVFNL